jgi:hypothetical protein
MVGTACLIFGLIAWHLDIFSMSLDDLGPLAILLVIVLSLLSWYKHSLKL